MPQQAPKICVRNILLWLLLATTAPLCAASEKIHFLIPGGAGGGWDTTARGVGEALARSGTLSSVSYENISGGGGGKALAHLIETGERQQDTLMISSTPIILRSLTKIFPQSFRDLTPVASLIVDYGAFAVPINSPFKSWQDVVDAYKRDPRLVKVAGGSSRGGMDHLITALAIKKSGADPKQLRYIPYNAGGQAMVGLLSKETHMLSTGLSEAIPLARQGEVRILAITAPERVADYDDIPTLTEQGVPAIFENWRGVFGPPNLSPQRQQFYREVFTKLYQTSEWQRVRRARGWTDFFVDQKKFEDFLVGQEREMRELLEELDLL